MLDDFGLPAALTAHLRGFSERTGIRSQLAETLDVRLPPALEVAVYRICQEALTNVARHSEATACTVALSAGDGLVLLVVEDNGVGFHPATVPAPHGLGLIGMRERAQALGGTFAIETRAGGGTQVRVSLPFENTVDAAAAPEQVAV
jgi:signal transduction histidine kinase